LTPPFNLIDTGPKSVDDDCRVFEVTQPTYHRLGQQYGGMQAEQATRLTQLEK
jgi:putative transposase